MVYELQRAYRVRYLFYTIALAMCEIVHRVYAPLIARTVMVCVLYTVYQRVAQQQIGVRHVYPGTQRFFAVLILACFHIFKQLQVLFYAAVAVRAIRSRRHCRSFCSRYFFRCAVIYVSQSFLYQGNCKCIQLIKIVTGIKFIIPGKSQPLYIILYAFYIFGFFCHWVGIVKPQITFTAIFFRQPEVEADGGSMSYMQVAIRLRRKTGMHPSVILTFSYIVLYYFL